MNRKFYIFCIFLLAFSIVFRGFSYLETGSSSESGSGSKVEPPVAFKKWRIGRSPETTSSKTFITSTQELCRFSASVGYGEIANKANTSPIDLSSVAWSVTEGSNEIALKEGSVQHNWSGPNPARLDSTTRFNVVGAVTVEKVVGRRKILKKDGTYVKNKDGSIKLVPYYTKGSTACTTDANRANRVPVLRGGTKMKFKLKFSAQTEAGQPVSAVLALEADDKDQLRQEYVDYDRPIPSRDDFTGEDTYDFGHYTNMLNESLDDNFQNWIDSMNKRERKGKKDKDGNPLSMLTKADFTLNSGFRQPHHNFDHGRSTALLSPHMYGYALDVNGRDLDGKGGADQSKMVEAARNANPRARWSQQYSGKSHVHADWAPTGWGSGSISSAPTFSLPPAGTDTVACDMQTENNCRVQVSSASEHSVTCPGNNCGDTYWTCDSDDYDEHRLRTCNWERLPLGRVCNQTWRFCEYPVEKIRDANHLHTRGPRCLTDPNGFRHCAERNTQTTPPPPATVTYACGVHDVGLDPVSSHALQASCSVTDSHGQQCTVTGFYNCLSHTHQYPALITGACGHTYTSANASLHAPQASCSVLNANGDSCTVTDFYNCLSPHTHQYPAPVIICARRPCNDVVGTAMEHWVTCSAGHAHWSCHPWHENHHKVRTCRRAACGQSWQRCARPANDRTPDCLASVGNKCAAIQ